jgi:drug/metabolite transporter (DMT)-like permease
MLTASTLNGFRMFLYAFGFTYASIGGAVIMLYTWPLFVSLFAIPMAKEPLDLRSGLLLLAAFIGIVLVFGGANISFSDNNFIGLSAILLNSIILAIVTLIFRDELATRSQFHVVYFQNLAGAIMFLPFFLLNRPFPTLHQITIGSIYAFLVGIISFSLFFYALKHFRMIKAASLSYIEVISAIFFAYIFFGEPLTWNKLVGAVFILGAASLIKK